MITIIASYAQDHITNTATHRTATRHGGPAYWIEQTIKSLRVPHRVVAGRPARVRVVVDHHGEHGTMERVDRIDLRRPTKAKAFIISTVHDEFDLNIIPQLCGIVAVDIQGYVRAAHTRGQKLVLPSLVRRKVAIMKGTIHEYRALAPALQYDQKRRILIITKGQRGALVYDHGKRFIVKAHPVHAVNTIGAGDVFLAAFVVKYIRTNNVRQSGRFAADYTAKFLTSKRSHFFV